MKSYWILFLCLSCLWACGCRGMHQRRSSALERENSQLNGLVWEMQFELESLEEENADLKRRLADGDDGEEDSAPRPRRTSDREESAPFDPGDFSPPTIEFPDEPSPQGEVPGPLLPGQAGTDSQATGAVSVVAHEEPALLEPTIEIVPPEQVALDSRRIKRIELAPLIGTLHLDDKPGDDGLVIVVEPWDASDQMLADAADIHVVLIDPAEPAETSRYAQWHFDAKEAAKLFRDGDVPGLHLELPWPGDPPSHDQLHLFVRYTTSDGRQLETDSVVEIELGGQGRWVATETPRLRPYEEPIKPAEASAAAPQLLAASSAAAPAKPVEGSRRTPVRTVSAPRERRAEAAPRSRDGSPRSKPEPDSNRDRLRALPRPESVPASEPPARQRPTWSPDRPW
jgi:hypothetical protein